VSGWASAGNAKQLGSSDSRWYLDGLLEVYMVKCVEKASQVLDKWDISRLQRKS
jgi:hypothetical protein